VGFTESLSFELAPLGIRARYIAPGGVTTEFAVQDAEQADSLRLSFPHKVGPAGSIAQTVGKAKAKLRGASRVSGRAARSPPVSLNHVIPALRANIS